MGNKNYNVRLGTVNPTANDSKHVTYSTQVVSAIDKEDAEKKIYKHHEHIQTKKVISIDFL